MKTLLGCITIAWFLSGCSTVNTTTGAETKIRNHQSIAILPFEVRFDLRNNNRRKFTEHELAEVRHFMALGLQQHLYNWLKAYSYKKTFSVSIQNIEITDSILNEKKVSYLVLYNMPRTEIAQMLNVDAVLTPNVIFAQPHSDAAAAVITAIPGQNLFYNQLATQEMKMQVLLTDRETENSFWTFETKTRNGKYAAPVIPKTKEDILYPLFENIDKTLMKFIKKFPYLKN